MLWVVGVLVVAGISGALLARSVGSRGANTSLTGSGASAQATVTVPAGQTSKSFTFVNAAPSGTVTVTATFGGTTSTANITVQTGGTHLVINEIDYDMPSTDNAEFIELYNPGATAVSLAGKKLLLVNGKYATDVSSAGGEASLFALLNELAAHERGG